MKEKNIIDNIFLYGDLSLILSLLTNDKKTDFIPSCHYSEYNNKISQSDATNSIEILMKKLEKLQ